ncbi:hypothetical protein OLX02_13665 [Novosphingobium sp. KCTC 2891]|uniref:tetratricopeptide repeat protein n=1 Tax=Novosphingobium sp. KCTC 2891 TaxID=2989730 RepID=UPI002221FFF8|nr:tetratricopeptide repeat protein [Novosphingobium sp. KCTC 2891]MCW1383867.1 hypothetical protein [Novosphingobium sp. KCTC 2891]
MRARMVIAVAALLAGSAAGSSARWLGLDPAEAAALAALDPARTAAAACRPAPGAEPLLRQRLRLAAALAPVQPGLEALPLYPDVPRSALDPAGLTPAARPWFDQGLLMAYNFNHAAAIASFRRAQALAPDCALCFWGEALAYGPNINAPMDVAQNPATLAALARAQSLAASAPPLDRALVDALARRYAVDPAADRAALDAAYADAMLGVAGKVPDNDEVAVLAAEAAMDTSPWNYWDAGRRTPNPRIAQAVSLVEGVLARHPGHQQAAHLYVHLMENYADPARAEKAADALALSAMPQAGHLVHMPSHIYYRIGRYADSIRTNIAAARADEAYLARVHDDGMYRYGYYPHNVHFIVASAQQAGDLALAVREADRLSRILSNDVARRFVWIQGIIAAPAFAYAQGASAAQILALPRPAADMPYVTAMWHYARAVARARQRDRAGFAVELGAMERLADDPALAPLAAQGLPAADLIRLAAYVARGRQAYAQGQFEAAADHYRAAMKIEATIPYQEPPYWYYPVGQSLGAALLRAGKPEEARDAFRQALLMAPDSGWALHGLAQAEAALGHRIEAKAAEAALERAWRGDPRLLDLDRL